MTRVMPDNPKKAGAAARETHAEPDWLATFRQEAQDRFDAMGYPTSQTEEYRFTPLSPITSAAYAQATLPAKLPGVEALSSLLFDEALPRLVFINGFYQPTLSRMPADQGVTIHPIRQMIAQDPDTLGSLLTKPTLHCDPFADLNAGQFTSGVVLIVSRNVQLNQPIHVLQLTLPDEQPSVSHSRNLIHLEQGSEATIIEHYAALEDDRSSPQPYWNNALTQITLDENARAHHYLIEEESAHGHNISTLIGHVSRDSHLASHTALLGGRLVRNNIHVELRGQGADATINGLFIGQREQVMDNHMRVIHGAPHCDSRQFYHGVLAGHAQGVFTGRIIVEQDAQKTDAKQTSRNLLLSDTARLHADPQLEIYADDVKCTHGATTGQLNPEALFYLQARGIPAAAARQMLIRAFANESLARMTCAPVRQRLEEKLAHALQSIQTQEESSS